MSKFARTYLLRIAIEEGEELRRLTEACDSMPDYLDDIDEDQDLAYLQLQQEEAYDHAEEAMHAFDVQASADSDRDAADPHYWIAPKFRSAYLNSGLSEPTRDLAMAPWPESELLKRQWARADKLLTGMGFAALAHAESTAKSGMGEAFESALNDSGASDAGGPERRAVETREAVMRWACLAGFIEALGYFGEPLAWDDEVVQQVNETACDRHLRLIANLLGDPIKLAKLGAYRHPRKNAEMMCMAAEHGEVSFKNDAANTMRKCIKRGFASRFPGENFPTQPAEWVDLFTRHGWMGDKGQDS